MRFGLVALPLLLAAGSAMPDPVTALAGRYSHHFRNGDLSGASYWSDDVVEVVPADATHIYVRAEDAIARWRTGKPTS